MSDHSKSKKEVLALPIAYTDTSAANVSIGSLPANAMITGIKVQVSTAFDSGTTDLVTVGISGSLAKYLASTSVASAGDVSTTLVVAGAVESASGSTEILVTYTADGTAATEGAGFVFVEYSQIGLG